jgi:hypothetical protein
MSGTAVPLHSLSAGLLEMSRNKGRKCCWGTVTSTVVSVIHTEVTFLDNEYTHILQRVACTLCNAQGTCVLDMNHVRARFSTHIIEEFVRDD